MQFIKKELLSALVAMDELMGSNEMNMQVAAMTPALMLLYAIRRVFQVLFYALFKVSGVFRLAQRKVILSFVLILSHDMFGVVW